MRELSAACDCDLIGSWCSEQAASGFPTGSILLVRRMDRPLGNYRAVEVWSYWYPSHLMDEALRPDMKLRFLLLHAGEPVDPRPQPKEE